MAKSDNERDRTSESQDLVTDENGGIILMLVQSILSPLAKEFLHDGQGPMHKEIQMTREQSRPKPYSNANDLILSAMIPTI